jgi:cyanophycin synthetase
VLAAAAAAYAQGLLPKHIRDGLASFVPSAGHTPGRLNVLETTRGRIMLDYAHNAAAIAGLVEFLVATPAQRRIALISAPGDRRDDDLREIGRLAARLDYVIPKEHDVYRRGRAPGAINQLITEGLLEGGLPADRTSSFVEEHDAVAFLVDLMRPGDVAVIIADDTAAVTKQLEPYLL